MPQVPIINRQIEQTIGQQNPLSTRASIEAFGGGPEQQSATQVSGDFARQFKEQADHLAVLEAEKKLNDFETNFLYDSKTGAFLKQGKDSFELPQELNEKYSQLKSEISKGLSTHTQQRIFDQRSMERKAQLDRAVMRHVANETQRFDDQTTQSLIESEQQAGILNYHDPSRIMQSADRIKSEITRYGARHGLPTEAVKLQASEAESKMHSGIIARMLDNGDDIKAEAYFSANKDLISGSQITQVEKILEAGSMRGRSQRFVDSAMSRGLSQSDALKEASKEENPKLRDALEERVQHQYGQKEMALRRDQDKKFDALAMQVLQSGDLPRLSQLQGLRPEQVQSLSHARNENTLRDDGVLYQDLRELAIKPESREKFLQTDLTKPEFYNNLSLRNWQNLRQIQTDLQDAKLNGRGLKTPELDGLRSDRQIIDDSYAKAFGKINKSDPKYINYLEVMDQVVTEYKQANKTKSVPNTELLRASDEWLKPQVIAKGIIWDSKAPKYRVLDDIPEEKIEAYKQMLTKYGKPVTQYNLLKYALKDLELKNGK